MQLENVFTMRRIFTLLSVFIICIGGALAQESVLSVQDLNYVADPANGTIEAHVTVVNSSNKQIGVKVKRVSRNLAPNCDEYFCFDVCYTSQIDRSGSPVNVEANGKVSDKFYDHLEYPANTSPSTSSAKFLFFVEGSPKDTASITINYFKSSAFNSLASRTNLGSAYPNPADDYTKVNYAASGNALLTVYNSLGTVVYKSNVDDRRGELIIPTAQLQQGVYFYTLTVNGKTAGTKKLIISHKD